MNLSIRNASRQSIVSIALLLALLCVSTAFAAFLYTKTLTGSIIVTEYGMGLYNDQTRTTSTTSLTFPSFANNSASEVYSQTMFTKNTGSASVDGRYFGINASGNPAGISVAWDWSKDNGANWTRKVLNSYVAISDTEFNTLDAVRIVLIPNGSQATGETTLTVYFRYTDSASG